MSFHTHLNHETMLTEPDMEFEMHQASLVSYSKDNQLFNFQRSHLNNAQKLNPEACLLKLTKLRAFASDQSQIISKVNQLQPLTQDYKMVL